MKKGTSFVMIGLVFLMSFTILSGCEKKDKLSMNNKEKIKQLTLPKEKGESIDLDIYFDSSKNENSVDVTKEERLINKEELVGELIVHELIKGPSSESKLKPVLPKETRLLSFSIKDGIAYVNLSREAQVKMTQSKEEACLKSIAASLTQLESVSKVKLLIDNKDVDTFGGNYNISEPFGKEDIDGRRK